MHEPILFQTCKFLLICYWVHTAVHSLSNTFPANGHLSKCYDHDIQFKVLGTKMLNFVEFSGVVHPTKKVEQGSSRTLTDLPTLPAFDVLRCLRCASPKKVEEGRFTTHLTIWPPAFRWPWTKQAPAQCASQKER